MATRRGNTETASPSQPPTKYKKRYNTPVRDKLELSNLIMGSRTEIPIGDPSIDKGQDFGDGNIGMAKHDSFEFDDSDDSFNDSWD